MELDPVHCHELDLTLLCHVQEDDETEAERINDRRHLVSITIRDKVLEYHWSHWKFLKEQEQMRQSDLQSPLEFKSQDS